MLSHFARWGVPENGPTASTGQAGPGGPHFIHRFPYPIYTMDAKEFVHQTVNEHPVVLFMKGTAQFPQCGFSGKAIQILKNAGIRQLVTINILEDEEVRQAVKDYSNWPTIPQLYINGEFIGGTDIMAEMAESGELQKLIPEGNKAA